MKDQTKIIAALLIGAAAGAALGLLLAPEKGETIREGIADYIDDLLEAAKNKAQSTTNDLREFGSSIIDQAKSKFSGLTHYADDAFNSAKSKVKETADMASDQFDEAKSRVKNTANDWNNSVQNS